jgi:hypothetical protein
MFGTKSRRIRRLEWEQARYIAFIDDITDELKNAADRMEASNALQLADDYLLVMRDSVGGGLYEWSAVASEGLEGWKQELEEGLRLWAKFEWEGSERGEG